MTGATARVVEGFFSVEPDERGGGAIIPSFDVGPLSSTDTKPPVESGNPRSLVGVGAGFFRLPGRVKSEMRPGLCFRPSSSPSSAFLAASSTLNDISFDVPRVCLLICAARVILSSLLPIRTSRIALRYPLLERSRSATISAAVITLMVLLGRSTPVSSAFLISRPAACFVSRTAAGST